MENLSTSHLFAHTSWHNESACYTGPTDPASRIEGIELLRDVRNFYPAICDLFWNILTFHIH